MMSTISGLIVGMMIAALVTVMYGQQLTSSLRLALDRYPAAKTLLERAGSGEPQAEPGADLFTYTGDSSAEAAPIEVAPMEMAPMEMAAMAMDKQTTVSTSSAIHPGTATLDEPVAASPATTGGEQPNLEQRWSEFLDSAGDMTPVGRYPWQHCFQRSAASYELPLALLLAIASGESNFDPAAISDKNAIGLMQIRWPGTSRHLGVRRQTDLYDPCTNVDAGARYIRELAEKYANNLHLVVAAYNYGPSRISSGRVPEGALWYSHYIYQHLQRILGQEPSATSELIAAPTGPDGGREVLMSFNRAHRARDFIAFLCAQVPGLNLQQQSESLGRHEVVLLYSNESEKRHAMRAMTEAGLETLGPHSTSTYHL